MNINGGWIKCTLVARGNVSGNAYADTEYHTWTFKGGVPKPIDATIQKIKAVQWSAIGQGSLKETNPITWTINGRKDVELVVRNPMQDPLIHLTRASNPEDDPVGIMSTQGNITTPHPLYELASPAELQWSSTSNASVFSIPFYFTVRFGPFIFRQKNPGLKKTSTDSVYLSGSVPKTAFWHWAINLTP